MTKDNLRKLTHADRVKGGKQSTEKKKLAAKIREMKKRYNNLDKSDLDFIMQRIADPNANIEHLIGLLDGALKSGKLKEDKYVDRLINIHKLIHGERHRFEHSGGLNHTGKIDVEVVRVNKNEDEI